MRPPSARQLLASALIALGALAWTGCGGGGGSSTRTIATSSISEAAFAKRAEAICVRGRLRALRPSPAGAGQSERDAVSESIETTLLPGIQRVIDEIYALGAPAPEKGRIEAFLEALQQAVDEGEAADPPTVEGVERLLAGAGRAAERAGLKACAFV